MKIEFKDNLKRLIKITYQGFIQYYYAKKLINKIGKDSFNNWNVSIQFSFSISTRLLIIHYDHYENRLDEFPEKEYDNICKAIERQGIKIKREFCPSLENGYLDGTGYWEKHRLGIHIRQCQIDKCEIDYIEETKKVPILKGLCAELVKN